MPTIKIMFASLLLFSSAFASGQPENSDLVNRVEKMGLRTFQCEISGRQVLDPLGGFDGLSEIRTLDARQVLATEKSQAIARCLNQIAATKGRGPDRVMGSTRTYFMVRDLPELVGTGFNLFLIEDVKVVPAH